MAGRYNRAVVLLDDVVSVEVEEVGQVQVVVDAECDAELSECDVVECDDAVEVWDCDPDEDEVDEDLG